MTGVPMFPSILATWFDFFLGFFIFVFVFISLFLILLVLIQKGRGGGLASAFGGAGGNTAFGAKTGDVLTWATSIVFGIFLLLAIILNLMAKPPAVAKAPPAGSTPVQVPGSGK
jgi:preprotein translocase subunit SecG